MNFFPNLQIIFNLHQGSTSGGDQGGDQGGGRMRTTTDTTFRPVVEEGETPSGTQQSSSSASSSSSSSSSSFSSPTVSQIIQRILRPSAPITQVVDEGNGVQNDMHFYVNLDSMYPPITGLTVEQIHDQTVLSVFEGATPDVLCTVCQNPCEAGSIVQTIQECHHMFHPVCIERWLVQNNSCPVCRSVVAPLPTLQN